MLPQFESAVSKNVEVLMFTEYFDEFVAKSLGEYNGKQFVNICDEEFDLSTDEEKQEIEKLNSDSAELFEEMKKAIGDSVSSVRFTNKLAEHPVSLATEGQISLDMEKTLNSMPGNTENKVKAKIVLEINSGHPIAEKLKSLFETDKELLGEYAKLLYSEACLIAGRAIDNPLEHSKLVCDLMTK
jgi:molecular chaperone HtpG